MAASFKVALAIAIPLLLAATLGGLQVRSDLTDAANSSSSANQVTVLRPAVDYLAAAEQAMVAAQGTSDASASDLKAAVRDVQAAADELTKARDSADLTAEQRYQVDAMMDLSRAIRDADAESLSPGTWIAQLRQLQSGVTQLITTIVNAQIDPEPRIELLGQTLGGRFSLAMQQALAATETTGGTSSLELFSELGVEGAAIDRLASAMGDSEPAIAALRTANAQRTRTVRTGGDDLGGVAAYAEYDALIGKLLNGIDHSLAQSASDARRSALVSGGIVLGALLATIMLAVLVSRLLLNPIRRVREGARTVAHEQLPEAVARIRAGEDPGPITPIDVTTHEEVGQLARAVDDLHVQAVSLASGEARLRSQVSEMFITLSRRNTSLINQQLSLIETLEKDEEDPQRLESLFRLDHLAARMRRTADSLLILADAPTHTSADDDLTVASALEAATAGVQDYQRVRVGSASTAPINDAAAADVVHVLTELIDNALAYSAPTTTVLVSSTGTPDGVAVEIEDAGLGIPNLALAEINEMLRNGAEVTPDTARRMGLFVVSRLSQRHGISVALKRNRHNGITASVLLPVSLLEAAPRVEPPAPPVRTVAPPEPLPQPAAAARTVEPPILQDRLNAAAGAGLPRRQPGAQVPTTPSSAPAASASPAVSPPPAVVEPPAGSPVKSPDEPAARPTVEPPIAWPVKTPDEPAARATVEPPIAWPVKTPDEPAARATVEPPIAWPVKTSDEPAARATVEPPIAWREEPAEQSAPAAADSGADASPRETVDPAAVATPGQPPTAAAYSAAADAPAPTPATSDEQPHGPVFPPLADSEAEAETPIFSALRSAWLSANATASSWKFSEIEAGWAQADAVAASLSDAPVSDAGLPMRRPGTRIVPGGVAKPAKVGARDPEAIRKRLAAHAAGVSRGRAAAETAANHERSEDIQ